MRLVLRLLPRRGLRKFVRQLLKLILMAFLFFRARGIAKDFGVHQRYVMMRVIAWYCYYLLAMHIRVQICLTQSFYSDRTAVAACPPTWPKLFGQLECFACDSFPRTLPL
jgi:hypothetical protein